MWNYISPERHSRLDDRSGGAACSHKQGPREATLVSHGHALMENRHGVAVAGGVTRADGSAERRCRACRGGPGGHHARAAQRHLKVAVCATSVHATVP